MPMLVEVLLRLSADAVAAFRSASGVAAAAPGTS
jgi:hypothetical protein